MNRRKHPTKTHRRRTSFLPSKLKRFLSKNSIALISLSVSILVAFTIYFLSYSKPDIRAIRTEYPFSYVGQPVRTVDGKCYYQASVRQAFKNLSIKSGHIDKVTFTNWSEYMVPEFNLIEVDRDEINWREEKEIQVIYSITLDANACNVIREKIAGLDYEARFYDDSGKLINKAVDGEPIYFYAGKSSP